MISLRLLQILAVILPVVLLITAVAWLISESRRSRRAAALRRSKASCQNAAADITPYTAPSTAPTDVYYCSDGHASYPGYHPSPSSDEPEEQFSLTDKAAMAACAVGMIIDLFNDPGDPWGLDEDNDDNENGGWY